MKSVGFAAILLFVSINAFACPKGWTNADSFDESVSLFSDVLGQTVRNGSTINENVRGSYPHRILITKAGKGISIKVDQSNGNGTWSNTLAPTTVELCGNADKGMVTTVVDSYSVTIVKVKSGLSITAAGSMGSQTFAFGNATTEVAADRGANR